MYKSAAVLAVLVFLGASFCSASYRTRCDYVESECNARSTLFLTVSGTGSCSGSASSHCSATATAYSCYDFASSFVFGGCRSVSISADASCYASAAAEAFSRAYASAVCEGKSAYGCANASAEAEAVACAVSSSIVRLSIDLGHYNATCDAYVGAVVEAFASAVTEAQASVCVTGDGIPAFASDYQWASAVQTAITEAYANCFAYCDGYGYNTSSVSGGASGSTDESTSSSGGGEATTGDH